MAVQPVPRRDLESILAQTAPVWELLRGQRLFLTGGTGFFGCWLLESFLYANRALSLGASVIALTRSPEQFSAKAPHLANDPAVHLLQGDVRGFEFPKEDCQYLIHAATDTSAHAAEKPSLLLSSILDGTKRVLEFASASGVRRMLFVSSGAVYGAQPPSISHIPETYLGGPDWLQPLAAYGEGKRAAELMALLHAQQAEFDCVIARCFAFVGPHLPLNGHFAIGNFIRDVICGSPITIHGDGTPMRSYLYASDLATWLLRLLLFAPSGEAYNVGSDESVSIADLARTVVEALDAPTEIHIARKSDPGAPRSQYVPSIAKAREQVGLQVSVGLRDAIRRTAEWHRGSRTETITDGSTVDRVTAHPSKGLP